MSTPLGKRKLPRSTLPYLGNLLDKLSFSKLPTKKVVLQRVMFEIEHNHGAASVESAALTTQKELFDLWEYAGYRDILQDVSQVLIQIQALHESYKTLIKTPVTRRHKDSFKKKLALFTSSLDGLFDIAVEHLKSSNLITKEDRDFLKYHWRKTVSSTADHKTRDAVMKKLARKEKSADPFTPTPASTPTPTPTPASTPTPTSTPHSASSQESNDEFRPKRACSTTPRPAGTQVIIPRDVLKKVGPAADRLGLSHQQATAFLSSIINNSGGNLDNFAVSTSTARRSRATARAEGATSIKDSYTFLIGQINFDGKLLGDLEGSFDKVNRLAVVAVQVEGNQLLCIAKTDDSTGKVEAATVKEALDNWGISDGIIASCFDTTSSNTGIYSGSTVLLQQHLNGQLLWLSCRHHIPELILKAAFQTLFGKTTGPSAALFSCLKTSWKSLDLTDLRLPPTPAACRSSVDALLHFLDERLLPENKEHLTRGYYKELLELAKPIRPEVVPPTASDSFPHRTDKEED